jgi:hypothetical protein
MIVRSSTPILVFRTHRSDYNFQGNFVTRSPGEGADSVVMLTLRAEKVEPQSRHDTAFSLPTSAQLVTVFEEWRQKNECFVFGGMSSMNSVRSRA